MTTSQPNQLPEEVRSSMKRAIEECLLPLPVSGEAEIHPAVRESMCARILRALDNFWAPTSPYSVIAPTTEASAQLAAMRGERGGWQKQTNAVIADAEQKQRHIENLETGKRHIEGQLAAAQSEVGRLTKERDEALPSDMHFNALWQAAKSSLTAANAELVEARKDRERLDWLEEAATRIIGLDTDPDQPQRYRLEFWQGIHGHKAVEAETIRQAIDAALNHKSP